MLLCMGAVVLEVVAVITSDVYDIALCYKYSAAVSYDKQIFYAFRR